MADEFRPTRDDRWGAADDTFTGAPAYLPPVVESGIAVDVILIAVELAVSDLGEASEYAGDGTNAVGVEDAGYSADLVTRATHGVFAQTAADAFVSTYVDEFVPLDFQGKRVEDTGTGAEQIGLREGASIVEEDTAEGVDTVYGVYAAVSIPDTGIGQDGLPLPGIRAIVRRTDSGIGQDIMSAQKGDALGISDAGSQVTEIEVYRLVPISDGASGSEQVARHRRFAIADACSGADVAVVASRVTVQDTGIAVDQARLVGLDYYIITETVSGVDSISIVRGREDVVDAGTASEMIVVAPRVTISEAGLAEDTAGSFLRDTDVYRVDITISAPRVTIAFEDE